MIVLPSRKPAFWAEVDRLNRAEDKAAKKAAKTVEPPPAPAPKKSAKKAKARK